MKHFVIHKRNSYGASGFSYEVYEYGDADTARKMAKYDADTYQTTQVYYATSEERYDRSVTVTKV